MLFGLMIDTLLTISGIISVQFLHYGTTVIPYILFGMIMIQCIIAVCSLIIWDMRDLCLNREIELVDLP